MNWTDIADILGISIRTLTNRRQDFKDFVDTDYNPLSDVDLDNMVLDVLKTSPNSGERMVQGALRSRGLKIQRWRVREALGRVDPMGKVIRRLFVIKRPVYSVTSPNALW